MEDNFSIKRPTGAILFLSNSEFGEYCIEFSRKFPTVEVVGEPDSFPCVGFPVYTAYEEGRKNMRIFAFVYLHCDLWDVPALVAKAEWEPPDRFELALLAS